MGIQLYEDSIVPYYCLHQYNGKCVDQFYSSIHYPEFFSNGKSIIGKWITVYARARPINATKSAFVFGVIERKSNWEKEMLINPIQYLHRNNPNIIASSIMNASFQIKSMLFETTYLSNQAIHLSCNFDSSICIGCLGFNILERIFVLANKDAVCIEDCGPLCSSCLFDNTTCTKCISNIGVEHVKEHYCKCQKGFFYNKEKNLCFPCPSQCEDCDSDISGQCFSCIEGFTFVNNSCLCPDNSYFNEGKCIQCFSTCKECSGWGESECTKCFEGYYLDRVTASCIIIESQSLLISLLALLAAILIISLIGMYRLISAKYDALKIHTSSIPTRKCENSERPSAPSMHGGD